MSAGLIGWKMEAEGDAVNDSSGKTLLPEMRTPMAIQIIHSPVQGCFKLLFAALSRLVL
jgi:hypothetical protein